MKNISLIGFGELGKQFLSFLKKEELNVSVFDDGYISEDDAISVFKFESYLTTKADNFYVALGYKNLQLKLEIISKLKVAGRKIPSFIHSSSFVNNSATIGDAAFIYPKCNIDMDVLIGEGTVLNNSVTVSHNSVIGKCCYIAPGVIISGNVVIGDCTFIGTGVMISNNIVIGKNVTIGIGTVVTKDIPDGSCVIGNPMRFLEKPLSLR